MLRQAGTGKSDWQNYLKLEPAGKKNGWQSPPGPILQLLAVNPIQTREADYARHITKYSHAPWIFRPSYGPVL